MFERAMYAAILVAGLALSSAYRVDHQLDRKLVTQAAQLGATSSMSSQRCQYSAAPNAVESGRPYHEGLVALCPNNSLLVKCVNEAKSSAGLVLVVQADALSRANCESLCNENFGMEMDGQGNYRKSKLCRGYVVRQPFNEGVREGKAQCWLIHGDARSSKTFKTEVKIERSTLLDGRNNKITHHKEFCGCEARVVHFPRPAFRTELALLRHKLAQLKKEDDSNVTDDLATRQRKLDKKIEKGKVKEKVQELELQEVNYQRLNTLEGVYDWLPIRVPHRIAKKQERILPGVLAKFFKPGLIRNQAGSWKNYWNAPVRMSKIYKKTDLSAFLYLCLNKSSMEENWYLTKRDDMITWAGKTFRHLQNQSEENINDELSNIKFLEKAFFRMECTGTKIGRDNKVTYQVKGKSISESVDRKFWHGEDLPADSSLPMPLEPFGCYLNAKKAQDAVEEQVQKEVGRCPIEELSTSQKGAKEQMTFLSMFRSGNGTMRGLQKAKYVIDTIKSSPVVTKWLSKGYSWWTGKKTTDVKQLHDYENEDIKAMMERTTVLIDGISKLWLVMEAAGNTEDVGIKSVCAREVLDQIFKVGGLMPKVSQNLAMRPDLVKDDFIRNKLKETQNANPSRGEKGTLDYVSKHNPKVKFAGFEPVPLLDMMEYKKALSAGSVGQVDLFTLRKDLDPSLRRVWTYSLPDGHGDTVIVKTVFEETETAYQNDWALLELFFTNCGDNCDAKMRVIWKCLEPMKESIFNEFDLKNEARYTERGRKMLKDFTQYIQAGEYSPVLNAGDIVLTTPRAIETDSNYFLIQSMAAGTPLKNFLEDSGGQIEHLVDWKQKIYSAILMVYGFMVVKHGFFQADPHNGNWFWEPESKTVTLIDWGGVEDLDGDTHCKLANLYSHLGKLTKAWSDCEAVKLWGQEEVAGTYRRAGFSIYQAGENQTALFYGRTYGVSYFNQALGLRLFYNDEGKWNVVREHPGTQELTETVAELETKVTNMMDLAYKRPETWRLKGHEGKILKYPLRVTMEDPKSCKLPTRSEAYSLAAYKMGLKLNFACKAEDTVVVPEAPLSEDEDAMSQWKDNGKRQLGRVTTTEEETFLEWGLYAKLKLIVETKDGKRTVKLPDNNTYDLDEEPKDVKVEGWILDAFSNESQAKIAKLSEGRQKMPLKSAQAQLAVATSLYDSDMLMAAVLGLQAKDSVGLITPIVPNEYVMLARCIVVFHGMLGDVLKDNFVRFAVTGQQDYIQWLVRSGGDRFFRSWLKPAENYTRDHRQCPTEDWKALDLPES